LTKGGDLSEAEDWGKVGDLGEAGFFSKAEDLGKAGFLGADVRPFFSFLGTPSPSFNLSQQAF
jgi:hypothetical protein